MTEDKKKEPIDIFDELDAQMSPEFNDLLSNPFDEEPTDRANAVQTELADATMMAQRAVTTEKLIDRLPEHRQNKHVIWPNKLTNQICPLLLPMGPMLRRS